MRILGDKVMIELYYNKDGSFYCSSIVHGFNSAPTIYLFESESDFIYYLNNYFVKNDNGEYKEKNGMNSYFHEINSSNSTLRVPIELFNRIRVKHENGKRVFSVI